MNEIIPLNNPNAAVLFAPGGLDDIIDRIESDARSLVPDLTTAKGRKEIASVAAKVASSKVYLDGIGKDYVAELKEMPKRIDAVRKEMRDRLDALRDEVRRPLTDWENSEASRVDAIRARISEITAHSLLASGCGSNTVEQSINAVLAIQVDESFAELQPEASQAQGATLATLHARLKQEQAHEETARIAAEHAAEQAKREQAEREARIAAEAAERARKEAEAKADREAKEIALQAIQQQREAEARHQAEIAEMKSRERREREALERAENDRKAKQAAEAKRAADEAHRSAVHAEIISDLEILGVDEKLAESIVIQIASGFIGRLSIRY